MAQMVKLLICSDIHYASDAEKARAEYETKSIASPLQRLLVRFYRNHIWLRDPFAHNHLLEHILKFPDDPDFVIANGDYSCDSAFIGVADGAARESARLCLTRLRDRFGTKFSAVFGDHELGKVSLCGGHGGLRLESLRLAREELKLEPAWTRRVGRYVLVGVTSTLAAMPVYESEALEPERNQWRELALEHLHAVRAIFSNLRDDDRVLLFCHDPTALPFLWELNEVRHRSTQIERTIIGHLHTEALLWQSRMLRGIPKINFCGTAVRRMSSALSRASAWQHFNILLCPSLAGIELFKRGGYYTAEIDPDSKRRARFQLHPIRR
jgi:hypothetical protein